MLRPQIAHALLSLFWIVQHVTNAQDVCTPERSEDLLDNLLTNYNPKRRPSTPIVINVTYVIQDIKDVDEVKGIIQVQSLLIQSWIDPRLRTPMYCDRKNFSLPIGEDWRSKFWYPPSSIWSAAGAETVAAPVPQLGITLEPYTGLLTFNWQQLVKLPCRTNYRPFPFDSIDCSFYICKLL